MNRAKNSPLLVVDLETSGVNPLRHRVVAAAAVPFDDDAPPLELYIKHDNIEWNDYARSQFDKYAARWTANAVTPRDACDLLESYLELHYPQQKVTLIGHNIGFDVAFLRQLAFYGGRDELRGIYHRAVDTHTLLYVLFKQGRIPESALTSDGAFKFFNIQVEETKRHTALDDALATKLL